MKLYRADCLDILRKMESKSVDSIVCDPPYGIGIQDQKWDNELPNLEIWKECLRVLRPGGHIVAFASARLYHLLAADMERAGFETQSMMGWLYGNGFPKGVNLSLQFDKGNGLVKPDDAFRDYLRRAINKSGYKIVDLEKICGTNSMFSHYLGKSQPQFPSPRIWKILKEVLDLDSTYDDLFEEIKKRKAEFVSRKEGVSKSRHFSNIMSQFERLRPKSEKAKKWEGWRYGKSTLRPCLEPIYLGCRPPLRPMVENIQHYGTGALNVGACNVKGRDGVMRGPSSIMHDGSDAVEQVLSQKSKTAISSLNEFPFESSDSSFFYVPRPSSKERKDNKHPTVKPLSLIRQLVRLITPPGGECVDPFMGSGTTGVACILEGMEFTGIEKEQEYFETAFGRIADAVSICEEEKWRKLQF